MPVWQQERMQRLVHTSRAHNLSFAGLALLILMIGHCDEQGMVIWSRREMAKEMECSRPYVSYLLDRLEEAAKIKRIPRYEEDGTQMSNAYQLLV